MAKSRARSNSLRLNEQGSMLNDPNHHLAGPFMPQTPLESNTPVRMPSPPIRKSRKRGTLRAKLFGWAVDPARSFRILCVPIIFYLNWEFVTGLVPTNRPNPFHAFIFLSNPVEGSAPGDVRYAKSYKDLLFLMYYIVFWSMVRETALNAFKKFARSWGIKKADKLARFGEQAYAVAYFTVTGVWGLYIMYHLPTWWYQTEHFWLDYPHWDMLPSMKRYYLMQIAYWCQQLIVLILGLEKPRKDYRELVIHHFVTLWLVGWSYLMNLTLIGNAVFVSMDIPDVFLAFSKVLNYLQFERGKTVSFAVFVPIWTYFRHYLNIMILISVWYQFDLMPEWAKQWNPELGVWMPYWLKYQIFAPILALHFVNLFWYFLILRIAYRAIVTVEISDSRSDDEDDGEDDTKED